MKQNNGSNAFGRKLDKAKDAVKKLKRFKEDHNKEFKVAVAVIVIAAAALFFGMKGESQNLTSEEEELLALSDGKTGEGSTAAEDLEKSLPVIYVDISGAVKIPGVYDVKEGTRVFEVIEMAGGLTDKADIEGFNRAEVVFDGQKISIPEKAGEGEAGSGGGSSGITSSGLININRATAAELDEIPGVGSSTAERIIAYREENGSFRKKEDIMNVSGIGEKTYEKMQDKITV